MSQDPTTDAQGNGRKPPGPPAVTACADEPPRRRGDFTHSEVKAYLRRKAGKA